MDQTKASASERLSQLCDNELQGVTFSSDYVKGLIFAVAAAPEIPMPETWLVWVFQQRGQLQSTQQADALTDALMNQLQWQLQQMRDEKVSLPVGEGFSFASTNDPHSPVCQWLMGLLAGHQQLQSVWQQAWDRVATKRADKLPAMQKELSHCLRLFSTFADIPMALEQARQQGNAALQDNLQKIFPGLTPALQTYVRLSGDLVGFMPNQFETFVQP